MTPPDRAARANDATAEVLFQAQRACSPAEAFGRVLRVVTAALDAEAAQARDAAIEEVGAAEITDMGAEIDELRTLLTRAGEALRAIADPVCSLRCPSIWRTVDGRPPHSAECQLVTAVLADIAALEPKP